eukprot:352697-Chlamydomonas_euryale.AAC.1
MRATRGKQNVAAAGAARWACTCAAGAARCSWRSVGVPTDDLWWHAASSGLLRAPPSYPARPCHVQTAEVKSEVKIKTSDT